MSGVNAPSPWPVGIGGSNVVQPTDPATPIRIMPVMPVQGVLPASVVLTVATFRKTFSAFNALENYSDDAIQAEIDMAVLRLPLDRWGIFLARGVGLLAAHNLALNGGESGGFGTPGAVSGPVSSKSVGGVSKSMDTTVAAYDGAGHYNLTTFGTRFWELVQIVGAGGMQL